ncbi:hypothetical protein ABZ930_27215 [Streptomyces sp. NPDC046716]|uniref:hypothetical protein n=1 Tax=Streptomyces sp. NPDC046716 TaxID=3157093 RepID=UPI0033E27598
MQSDTSVPSGRWDDAYALIGKMEAGFAEGRDRGDLEYGNGDDPEMDLPSSNRPAVFGSARELSIWLQEHPAP